MPGRWGPVNTVWRTDQGWAGTNTDVAGFMAPLQSDRAWSGATAVVLGNGGAARAVVAGCTRLGFGKIYVWGRNPKKLDDFRQSWANSPLAPPLTVLELDASSSVLAEADLIVNTTPVGMHPRATETPLDAAMLALVRPTAVLYDLIYSPRPTRLLQLAAQQGLNTLDGTEMLVQQGGCRISALAQAAGARGDDAPGIVESVGLHDKLLRTLAP
jgi:shikimate dehydrogenase